jgi:hypothetical protein
MHILTYTTIIVLYEIPYGIDLSYDNSHIIISTVDKGVEIYQISDIHNPILVEII